MYFSIPRLDTYHNIIFHRAWHKTYQLFSWLNKDEMYSRILKSSRRILQLLISTTNIHNVIVNSAFILKISYLENISATMYTIFSSDEPKLGFECRKLKKSSIMSPMLTKSAQCSGVGLVYTWEAAKLGWRSPAASALILGVVLHSTRLTIYHEEHS